MRRLQRLDRLLFWTLVPLWLGFVTAHGVNLARFGNVLTIPGVSRSLPEARQEYAKVLGVERGASGDSDNRRAGRVTPVGRCLLDCGWIH